MAKLHLNVNGLALCGAPVDPRRLVTDVQAVTCNGCRKKSGIWPIAKKEGDTEPDWSRKCSVCGQPPVLPLTGMCGPCTFGEADTVGGNW